MEIPIASANLEIRPNFAGLQLIVEGLDVCSGAAFELQDAARESEVLAFDGWEAEVAEGQKIVLVRGGPHASYEDAFRAGLSTAQKALDLMAMRGANNLVIKAFDDEHLAWWFESGDELVVRILSLAHVRFDTPPATAIVTDRAGNVVPQPVPRAVVWHESFRYFRLSQTTDDLFDAFRNAYLALESILSSIAPQHTNAAGKVAESEGEWFKRALSEAKQITPLAPYAKPGSTDSIQDLYDDLYVNTRSAMSHAKTGRKVLLPQDDAERAQVIESLRRLVNLYLKLAEVHLGARRPGGGLFAVAFRMMFSPTLERMIVYASDDESPLDKTESSPTPAGGDLIPLPTVGDVVSSEPFLVTKVWSADSSELRALPYVRRVVGMIDGVPGLVAVLNGRLVLGSARRLEVVMGARGSNTRQPRERYSF